MATFKRAVTVRQGNDRTEDGEPRTMFTVLSARNTIHADARIGAVLTAAEVQCLIDDDVTVTVKA